MRLAGAVAFLALGLLWLALAVPVVQATPGDLDPSFAGDGTLITDFGGGGAAGVALQADGKVVVGGSSGFIGSDLALARYNPNGSLDSSFSGDGRQTADFGAFDNAGDVAIQPDGKILLFGGVGDGGAHDFGLARFNPDGSLDSSFSGDGKQTIDFGGDEERVGGLALQRDGKIVAVGTDRIANDFALARLNPNGSLDATFSGDGKQTTDFGREESAANAAIQPDGKILAVGSTETTADGVDPATLPNAFALARYNPNGTLDSTFSGDGKQTTDFGSLDTGSDVAVQSDGKILAAGGFNLISGNFLVPYFGLARFSPNGSLDTSFAGDGKQETAGIGFGGGLALRSDGKIVAAGGERGDFTLARYRPDGSLDPTFACRGKQRTDFGGGRDAGATAGDIAVYPDGRIVAAGSISTGRFTSDFALARYLGRADRFRPRVRLILRRRQGLRGLVRGGLRFRVRANEAPGVRARLEISRRRARQLGIVRGRRARGRRAVTIGRGIARRPSACSRSRRVRVRLTRGVRQRLTPAVRRSIRRAGGLSATLQLRVSDAAGNSRKARRRIRFR